MTMLTLLLTLQLFTFVKIGPREVDLRTKTQNIINKIIWIIGTSRNAILVILCGAMSYIMHSHDPIIPFQVIGYIPAGLPTPQMPPFHLSANETTTGTEESFGDIVKSLGSSLIVLPMISLMEDIAICKAFCK